jgi:ligand-binding sensor domain-containing protein
MKPLTYLLSPRYLLAWLFSVSLIIPTHAADLTFTPASPIVEVEGKISLTVSGTGEGVTWTVAKGQIQGTGTQVTYVAPDQPGFDTVTALDNATGISKAVTIQVIAKVNFSSENLNWEIFNTQSTTESMVLSGDQETLWVNTPAGIEQRDAKTGGLIRKFIQSTELPGTLSMLTSDGSSRIWAVYEKDLYEGEKVVGHEQGLAYHSGKSNGKWITYNKDNGFPSENITALVGDGKGGIWVGTSEGLVYSLGNGQWGVFNTSNSDIPDDNVSRLLNDKDGLWVITSKGPAHLSNNTQWTVFNTPNSGLPNNPIWNLLNSDVGSLWIEMVSDGKGGIWLSIFEDFELSEEEYLEREDCLDEFLYFNMDKGDEFWWEGCGLDGKYRVAHLTNQGQWNFFDTDKIHAIVSDNQGGVWIGTRSGLLHFNEKGERQIFATSNSDLPNNRIRSLVNNDSIQRLWVGTQKGLAYLDANGQLTELNPLSSYGGEGRFVKDGKGGLWLWKGKVWKGGEEVWIKKLTHIYDDEESEVFPFPDDLKLPPPDEFMTLVNDYQGGVWMKTTTGLAHLDNSGQWTIFQSNSPLPDEYISLLAKEGKNEVWTEADNEFLFEQYATGISISTGDNNGGIWVGSTDGGLFHRSSTGEWTSIDVEMDYCVRPDSVSVLVSDDHGGVWVGGYVMGLEASGGLAYVDALGRVTCLPGFSAVVSLESDDHGGAWLEDYVQGYQTPGYTEIIHISNHQKPAEKRAVILITGGGNDSTNSLWEATEATANYLYQTLLARKFANEEIYYLSPKGWADINDDGQDDHVVDAPRPERQLTLDDIRQAFTWAKERGKLDQPLYVFFIDHGDSNVKLKLAKSIYIEATELKTILDDYQNETGNQLVLVIDACYSGAFLPVLRAPNRAILTSASDNESAFFDDKQGFTRSLANGFNHSSNFLENFKLAKRDILDTSRKTAKTQTPQLDDDGDGVYNPEQDGQWLKKLKIDSNPQTAFTLSVESLTSSTTLPVGQSLTLQAHAGIKSGKVEQVFAEISPPRMNRVIDTNGTPILALPHKNLYLSSKQDVWQTTWNETMYNGDYEITFYAQDNQGNIANNETTVIITVTGGIEPPPQATVTFQLEKDRYQRGETFKATAKEDLGYGYDLYIGVQLPDGQILTMSDINKFAPFKPPAKWWPEVQRPQSVPLKIIDLPLPQELPTGQYCLYGVLSPAGNDVFEARDKGLWVMGEPKCFEVF